MIFKPVIFQDRDEMQFRGGIWDQVRNQFERDQAQDVWDEVWRRIRFSVWFQVSRRIKGPIRNQISEEFDVR